MRGLKLRLIKIINQCLDVKTFRFALGEDIAFKPGQYLILTLAPAGKNIAKAFSISNSPTEKGYIEFTKKITESEFSRALGALKIGSEYSIEMPIGKFTFEGEFPKCVFLSAGIGITPIRSILKYAADKKLSNSLILLYSIRRPECRIFKDDLSEIEKENRNIKIVYTFTHCDERVPGCKAGRIDERMIKETVLDYKERRFFICGPEAMVSAMKGILLNKLGLPAGNIITEDFTGY